VAPLKREDLSVVRGGVEPPTFRFSEVHSSLRTQVSTIAVSPSTCTNRL
jgi:hypothetical protein